MTNILRWFTTLLAALVLCVGLALAQESSGPDYGEWENAAVRAESILETDRAADEDLETLRAQLAAWREQFLAAQDTNAARIDTLQSQIDTLGAPPGEGEGEPPEIASRRDELTDQLAQLRAPVLKAEEAYTRADGLIAEIDSIIRERQTTALLELGPTPLNPALWPAALEDLLISLDASWNELAANATSAPNVAEARRNLPLILILAAVGVLLVFRGESWSKAGVDYLRGRLRRGSGVFRFLVSLGQILLPWLGILALTTAALASGLMGPRGTLLLGQVPVWAFVLQGIHWLASESFNENEDIATLPLAHEERATARYLSEALAWLYVLKDVLDTLIQQDGIENASAAVMHFPVLVLSGVLLFRLGRVRNEAPMAGSAEAREGEEPGVFRLRLARLIGRAAMIVGVIGPVMAAIGYLRVGEALVYPFISSLALIGLVLVLQRFINDLYQLVTGESAEENNSLLPIMGGFVVALAALPLLALTWGARTADLTEIWARFREGYRVGDTQISPMDFLVVVIVFVAGYMLTRLFQGALRTTVLPKTKLDQGGQNAIVSGIGYIGIFAAALIAITSGGLNLSAFAYIAGALSVGIGFGLQNIVSNFVSGIILLVERPIGEGDWIEVNGTHGIVKDISVRSTRLETFDKYDLIIPNADFVSGTVANYTRGNSLGRIIVSVGVAYGSDTRKVEKILLDIARHHDMVLMNPAPYVYFKGFGADSMDFEIRAILVDIGEGLAVRTEMHHQIAERFAEEGVEIPFAQRDVWLRNPEALSPGGRNAPEEKSDTLSTQSKAHLDGKPVSEAAGPVGDGDD